MEVYMWEKLKAENAFLVVVDLQEKFYPLIEEKVLKVAKKNILLTISMLKMLKVPMIGTEHYVKGLGPTDRDILAIWDGPAFTDKVTFSSCKTSTFLENLKKLNKKKRPLAIVFGLETHICVLQTVLDLIKKKYKVVVVNDCCLSSNKLRWKNGLELMERAGAYILNTETLLFYLLQRADSVEFKQMVKLLKDDQQSK